MYSLNARDHFNCSPLLFLWPAPQNRCGQTEGGLCRVGARNPNQPLTPSEIGQGVRSCRESLPKSGNCQIYGPAYPSRAPIEVKFRMAQWIRVPLHHAKFCMNRCNGSPLRGENAVFLSLWVKTMPAVCRLARTYLRTYSWRSVSNLPELCMVVQDVVPIFLVVFRSNT